MPYKCKFNCISLQTSETCQTWFCSEEIFPWGPGEVSLSLKQLLQSWAIRGQHPSYISQQPSDWSINTKDFKLYQVLCKINTTHSRSWHFLPWFCELVEHFALRSVILAGSLWHYVKFKFAMWRALFPRSAFQRTDSSLQKCAFKQ